MGHETQAGVHAPIEGEQESLVSALEGLVSNTAQHSSSDKLGSSAHNGPYTPAPTSKNEHKSWWSKLASVEGLAQSRLDDLFAEHHLGNWIAIRGTNEKIFESMPIAVRLGMHLLFFGSKATSLLRYNSVEDVLESMSARQGRIYDDASDPEAVLQHVKNFIETYSINLSELAEPDPTKYRTMNDFFYRKLKSDARPIADADNSRIVSSAADCRITVFDNVESATKVWIKGKKFSLAHLVGDANLADRCFPPGSALAIFRLAPADYHRYHHPVGPATVGPIRHEKGEYYTVNPQAVNQNFDVFTANRRDVLLLDWKPSGAQSYTVAFVAIGALLVGSIGWSAATQGSAVTRGEEAGWFAYGGSTIVAVFPPEAKVKFDQDLIHNSQNALETMVRVGDRIGISEA
ncbi:hypothetical protein IE81DRAFT_322804 [Ceraceosorus guamensis]|uniref:phosphatidylserine decarboxylase n=1 Tax=Ceraceosorus guamensis TaxID=1522189 RepID=A0A316VZJ4_9BASI|nr:hypothetical protein IE81DRAFT_322804 [Ceraceosorus guamensis]PWN43087.1 hypothetical protein IE81DRAFT_322804 [Ceraceosorus guamensis]